MSRLLWTKTHPLGDLLAPAYQGDGGYDLVAVEAMDIGPLNHGQGVVKVSCGIRIALPNDMNAMVLGRSNTILGGLLVVNTLVDAGYRGHLFVLVLNLNPIMTAHIAAGDRLAQLVLLPLMTSYVQLAQVEQDDLPPSERGSKAFGSSGGVHASVSPGLLAQARAQVVPPQPEYYPPGNMAATHQAAPDATPRMPNSPPHDSAGSAASFGRPASSFGPTDRGGPGGPEELPGA